MTIKLEITDPQQHGVLELRAIAHFFNCLAADKQGDEGIYASGAEKMLAVDAGKLKADRTVGKARELGMGYGPDSEASTAAEDHHVVLSANGGRMDQALDNVGLVESPIDSDTRVSDDPATVFGGEVPKPADAVAPTPPAPVAPVAPTAPASTAPAPATPNSEIATDKAGLPWDRRIHSESKSINKTDGLWRTKRGVDPVLVATVEAELRNVMTIPKPGPTPIPTADPAPVAPTAPTAPMAPVSAQASTTPKNLGELMVVAQQLVASGKIASLDVVRATAAELGVVALPLLGTRPDMVEAVYNKLIGA